MFKYGDTVLVKRLNKQGEIIAIEEIVETDYDDHSIKWSYKVYGVDLGSDHVIDCLESALQEI